MQFAYFSGCKIPFYLSHYGTSTRAVLEMLGVELVQLEFNCCGYPIRNLDHKAYLLQAARNLAIAEQNGLDILTPCKCCFGSLKLAAHFLEQDHELKRDINCILEKEGLSYRGHATIRHLLQVLSQDVGLENISKQIKSPLSGFKIAANYGCHALRPSSVTGFDDPFSPSLFEDLVRVTGAEPVNWQKRLDCCGRPVAEHDVQLSLRLMEKKLQSASEAGADFICTACTYCQIQFDSVSQTLVPSVLYPQLLGLSLGLPEKRLGLDAYPVVKARLGNSVLA